MKMMKFVTALSFGAFLAACGSTDVVTRNAPLVAQNPTAAQAFAAPATAVPAIQPQALAKQINVAQINVRVPTSLKVSEANRYYPGGDIVWREDPLGNRHAQVAKILQDSMKQGTAGFNGPASVILDVQLVRFHALSEKARYTVGGVHHIVFDMALRDAKTGKYLSEPRRIETDLSAFGGQQAKDAEARGHTQKVRIQGHLAEVIRQQMTRPEGYKNASLGFYQLVNRL